MIKSKNIRVYPTAYRGKVDLNPQGNPDLKLYNPESRLTTEGNLVRPYKLLADFTDLTDHVHDCSGSFVISNTVAAPFEFVIDGYYFRLYWDQSSDNPFQGGTRYYAKIRVYQKPLDSEDNENVNFYPQRLSDVTTNTETNSNDITLDNQNKEFIGLQIEADPASFDTDNFKYLLLVDNGVIPAVSKLKIKQSSVDGGNSKPLDQYLNTETIDATNIYVATSIQDNEGGNRIYIDCTTGDISNTGTIYTPEVSSHPQSNLMLYSDERIIIQADGTNNQYDFEPCISLVAGGTQNNQYYKVPDAADYYEPGSTSTNENILATRDWLCKSLNDTWIQTDPINNPVENANNTVAFTLTDKVDSYTFKKIIDNIDNIKIRPTTTTDISNYQLLFTLNDSGSTTPYYNGVKIASPSSNELVYNPKLKTLTTAIFSGRLAGDADNAIKLEVSDIGGTGTYYLAGIESLVTSQGSKNSKFITAATNASSAQRAKVVVASAYDTLTSGRLEATYGSSTLAEPSSSDFSIKAGYRGIYSSGGIKSSSTITASTFNATSDERLKENIKPYKCDKSILDLEVKEFDFISDKSHHIGCIAQDLQEICPEIVHEGSDGYLSIEENKIVYLLLNEVKRLRAEVDELKNK